MLVADERADEDLARLRRRLRGARVPDVEFQSAPGLWVNLRQCASRPVVLFFFGGREVEVPGGEPELRQRDRERVLAWRKHQHTLARLNHRLLGVSTQTPLQQARLAANELLAYDLLSDPDLDLAYSLGLPASDLPPVYEPLTLIVRHERIEEVFRPVDVASEARSVVEWVRGNP